MSRFNVHDEVIFKGERAFVVNVIGGGEHVGGSYTVSTQRGEIRNVPGFLLTAAEQSRPPTDPDVGAMLLELNLNLMALKALNRRLERLLHLAEAMSKQRKR